MNTLRQRLKRETAGVHQELHRLSVSKKLLTGEISNAEYAQYLEAHRYFYRTLDHHFFKDESGLIANSACFVDWLSSDLDSMKRYYTPQDHSHVYTTFSSVIDRSLASELGYAYVKYGSMFGAGVIFNILGKKIIGRGSETRALKIPSTFYFANVVSKQKVFWEQFESALYEYGEDEKDGDRVVQSAIKSFEMVFSLLSEGAAHVSAKNQLDHALMATE